MAIISTTYFWMDEREDFFEFFWLVVLTIWYAWAITSLLFVFLKRKIGYLLAGIIAWTTVGFWMFDNFHVVFDISIIASKPDLIITLKNFIGVVIAGLAIFASHNLFHKSRFQ